MRIFLNIFIITIFSFLNNALSEKCVDLANGKNCGVQEVAQHHSIIHKNKLIYTSDGIFQSFEETENDDESASKSFSLKPQKTTESLLHYTHFFVNTSLSKVKIAYRHSRCIHFRNLLI